MRISTLGRATLVGISLALLAASAYGAFAAELGLGAPCRWLGRAVADHGPTVSS